MQVGNNKIRLAVFASGSGTNAEAIMKRFSRHQHIEVVLIVTNRSEAGEKEEYESYTNRMSDKWLKDLEAIGTDWNKPFLETAPYLIIVFKRAFEYIDGKKWQNYYVNESVGIACGMLINAIHNAGLITLTHTPSPMNFLTEILGRPDNERPYLLLPVGHAAKNATVPNLHRKPFSELCIQYS
jgi:nitroreductase